MSQILLQELSQQANVSMIQRAHQKETIDEKREERRQGPEGEERKGASEPASGTVCSTVYMLAMCEFE